MVCAKVPPLRRSLVLHSNHPAALQPKGPSDVHFIQMEPSTRYNVTCAFCAGRSMDQGDLDPGTFRRVLAAFPRLEHMQIQGEGEPLLSAHFFEMTRIARDAGSRISIITNGSLSNDEGIRS